LHAGIRAALPGDISPDQLVAALHAASSGLLVLHPSHANEALPAGSAPTRALDELAETLTRRELEVLQMLASGLSNKEIAARLSISEHTVKFHVAAILGKLGASSRTEAVSLAIRRGLVLL
jgi:two-component system, NarL family, response regulator YdfI